MATSAPLSRGRHESVTLKPAQKIMLGATIPFLVGLLVLMATREGWYALLMLPGPIVGLYLHHVHRFPQRKHT